MADARTTSLSGVARVADYLFGRNTLIGIATLMLLAISGYATWSGMHDFIIGVSSAPETQPRDMPGGFSLNRDAFVIAIVATLTFLMWLALRETFGAQRRITERLVTFPLYVFLALWSIGFGYGFWWSLIAGNEATRTSISRLQEDARDAAGAVAARLQAVRAQLDGVTNWSESQLRHRIECRPRPALQCAARRARPGQGVARRHRPRLDRPGAGRPRSIAQERRPAGGRHARRAPAALRRQGGRDPRHRPRHRGAQQRARRLDRRRHARARREGLDRAEPGGLFLP